MPVGAVGGEDTRTLVPGKTDVPPGTGRRGRCRGATRRWLQIE